MSAFYLGSDRGVIHCIKNLPREASLKINQRYHSE